MSQVTVDMNAFCQNFVQAISEIHNARDDNVAAWVAEKLVPLCDANVHDYFIAQALLEQLVLECEDNVQWGETLRRISRELELGVQNKEGASILSDGIRYSGLPLELAESFAGMVAETKPTSRDILRLYNSYNSAAPPRAIYLRDPAVLNALVADIFVPNRTAQHLDEKIWLIAYAASVAEYPASHTINKDDIEDTIEALKSLDLLLSKVTSMGQMEDNMSSLLELIRYPVVSMALLHWLEYALRDRDFYEWSMIHEETPAAFNLIDEIVIRHPLVRKHATRFWFNLLQTDFEQLSPLMMLDVKQRFIDRLILMIKAGYTLPIIHGMIHADSIDESLRVSFIEAVLSVVEGPYPKEFSFPMAQLISSVSTTFPRGSQPHGLVSEVIAENPSIDAALLANLSRYS